MGFPDGFTGTPYDDMPDDVEVERCALHMQEIRKMKLALLQAMLDNMPSHCSPDADKSYKWLAADIGDVVDGAFLTTIERAENCGDSANIEFKGWRA